ncbi:MAG: cyclopropane-fatty-acyl-phospholipid synthase family protein [Pseudomonadota bacterium]|nr:cyclopropane-fatty-acyl-phospholipid synthase family protein [Pseudomonadota bacterium]
MLLSPILQSLEQRLRRLDLPISVNLWNGASIAAPQPSRMSITLRTPGALWALIRPTFGKIAARYVEEEIDFDGNTREMVRLAAALCGIQKDNFTRGRVNAAWWRHSRPGDREAIQYHYDVADEFYALWLDRQRVYSCAYFRHPDDSLDQAQAQKLAHICNKLNLRAGERFLDIGCGWGALILWAARHYGVKATGITLSENQCRYVQQQIAELGLSGLCEVRLLDYRDLSEHERFDKIASVGMFEHVGEKNLPLYFGKIYRLLEPGGLILNHGITLSSTDNDRLGSGIGEFIDEYVFPGGELVHVSKAMAAMSEQRLECWDVECLQQHYAKTLWHWVDRLEAGKREAIALVGEKKFRIWRIYMAGSAHAFERGWMSIYQVLGGKPLPDGRFNFPLTREYLYERSPGTRDTGVASGAVWMPANRFACRREPPLSSRASENPEAFRNK